MDRQTLTLQGLIERAFAEMERLEYSAGTIAKYRCRCREFTDFVASKSAQSHFSEEIAARFLKEVYDYPNDEAIKKQASKARTAISLLRLLGSLNQDRAFRNRSFAGNSSEWGGCDTPILESYEAHIQSSDLSISSKNNRICYVKRFYNFLDFRGVCGLSEITAPLLSDYVKSLQGYSAVHIRQLLYMLRVYLKFAYATGCCERDWTGNLPKMANLSNKRVPALWSEGDVEKLLGSIDRSSPLGRRDYAMLLLATRFGIRTCDIAALRLNYLNWAERTIEFPQQKTGKLVNLTLFDDIAWAIIEYIRNGRPKVESPYVFLTANAPYLPIESGSIKSVLIRRKNFCGLKFQNGTSSGMHSLRHSLARRLLEHGESLESVSDIMGHAKIASTSPYVKVDVEGMRECVLSLEGVVFSGAK